jgi:hypothetical protein
MDINPLQTLLEDLAGIRVALQEAELDQAHHLLIRHDRAVREFMHSDDGRQAGYDALAHLLREQLEVQARLTRARDEAAHRMHSSQQADRAARAYLASAGG